MNALRKIVKALNKIPKGFNIKIKTDFYITLWGYVENQRQYLKRKLHCIVEVANKPNYAYIDYV